MNNIIERGQAVHRELRSINKTSKKLFEDTQIDLREGFKKILRERQAVFSAKLEFLLTLFEVTRNLMDEWKANVFTGAETFSEADEKLIQTLFSLWRSAALLYKERGEFYERHGLPLDRSVQTRMGIFLDDANAVLGDWVRPGLSMAIGLRTRKLSAATKDSLDAMRSRKVNQALT